MAELLTPPGLDRAVDHAQQFAGAAPADPYADHDAIAELVKKRRDETAPGKIPFTDNAFLNLLFYRNHQWVTKDRVGGRFRPARLPASTPQPVTNKFKPAVKAVTAVFARIEPRLNFRPGTDEPEDRATADVASRTVEVIEDEVKIRRLRQMLAAWVGLTNGAWIETGYDPDPIHGTRFLQHEECLACGMVNPPSSEGCAACGAPETQPAVNMETGEPLGEQVPVGKMYADVCSLFEMFFDPAVTDSSRHRWLLREKLISPDEAKQRWPAEAESITTETASGGLEGAYAEALPTLGSFIADSTRRGLDAPRAGLTKFVTERWYWQLPDATYPQGLLAITLGRSGAKVVHAGPLPYTRRDGTPFLPFVQFSQELVPGTAWPSGVADDLRMKQTQRNQWESMIMTAARAFGQGKWFIPEGSNIGAMTGEADVVRYNPLVGGMSVNPQQFRVAGDPMTNAFIAYLEKIDEDFEEISGLFELLKGNRPEGVSAGIALQILQERGMSRFAPLFILWEDAWATWATQALEIFRQFATEPRLLRIQGKDGAWQVQKFLGADLVGKIDVVAEANSSLPRSTMLERAEIEQLVAQGFLNPQDPETRYKVLEIHGKTSMIPGMAADTKNAMMENEAFAALAQHQIFQSEAMPEEMANLEMLEYPQIVELFASMGVPLPRLRPSIDDHGIHARETRKYAKSESAMALPPLVQLIIEKHVAYHDLLLSQQMQAVQQAQMMGGGGPSGPQKPNQGGNPGGPGQNPMRTGSSAKRMMGDNAEMGRDVAGVA